MTKSPEFGYKRVKFCDVNKPESYSDVSLKGKDNKPNLYPFYCAAQNLSDFPPVITMVHANDKDIFQ